MVDRFYNNLPYLKVVETKTEMEKSSDCITRELIVHIYAISSSTIQDLHLLSKTLIILRPDNNQYDSDYYHIEKSYSTRIVY